MARRPVLLLLWAMNQNGKIMNEKICSCALNRIFGFDPKIGLALISCIGSAAEIFEMGGREIDRMLGPYSKYRGLITAQALDEAEKELAKLEGMDIRFIGWAEDEYPELLHDCEDAPIGLYVRSTTPPEELWAPRRRIAVVGTRDISPYGREWCIRTVTGMAESPEKPAIVSGLALGTDFYAHRTALECGLPTIGVMATGPDIIYPPRHRDFAERLYHTKGCALITDYPPGTSPLGAYFLRRNRIIAGLSEATILIESKIRGGGLMTCNLAYSYNREVHALPGRADDIRSQGCNSLIKKKIAEPLISVEDLLKSLGLGGSARGGRQSREEKLRMAYGKTMTEEQIGQVVEILNMIRKERGLTVEDIAVKTGLPYQKASTIANILEADGFITIDLLQRCAVNVKR